MAVSGAVNRRFMACFGACKPGGDKAVKEFFTRTDGRYAINLGGCYCGDVVPIGPKPEALPFVRDDQQWRDFLAPLNSHSTRQRALWCSVLAVILFVGVPSFVLMLVPFGYTYLGEGCCGSERSYGLIQEHRKGILGSCLSWCGSTDGCVYTEYTTAEKCDDSGCAVPSLCYLRGAKAAEGCARPKLCTYGPTTRDSFVYKIGQDYEEKRKVRLGFGLALFVLGWLIFFRQYFRSLRMCKGVSRHVHDFVRDNWPDVTLVNEETERMKGIVLIYPPSNPDA